MSDDDRLDPLCLGLIDAARDGHEPQPGDYVRVRTKLVNRVGVAAFVATGAGAWSAWAKVAGLLSVLAIGGGAAYFALHRAEAPPVARPAPLATAMVAVEAPPAPSTSGAPVVEAPAPLTSGAPVVEAPAPLVPRAPVASARASVAGTSASSEKPLPSLSEETALLLGAQAAVREGDESKALGILREHAKRFPNGALSEERDAARIVALCNDGQTAQARDAALKFLATHPKSPAVARVRASCAGLL